MKQLKTVINTQFFEHAVSRELLVNYSKKDFDPAQINTKCELLRKAGASSAYLPDSDRYNHIPLNDYEKFRRKDSSKEAPALVYRLSSVNKPVDPAAKKPAKKAFYEEFTIETGLYCGVINIGEDLQLEIQTGYSDLFFKRMLNCCCGIYADTKVSQTSTESKSIYSLLVQYMFLISLRKVMSKTIPKKYVKVIDRGYNIKGNMDIEAYVNRDLLSFDKKITYTFSKQLEIQSIIDVLHTALRCCRIDHHESIPNLFAFQEHIKNLYSGQRPSKAVVKNILKEKCLSNGLYADFKKPLEYAKVLIQQKDLYAGGEQKTGSIGGFLVDASFLWEMYLYNLMKLNLPEWDISSQATISFYESTFYSRENYPDFVLRHKQTGKIFVLDAKFKKMNFRKEDVDNNDIRQLHAYSYYYHLTEGDKFAGAGLIYPTKIDRPEGRNNIDSIYGVKTTNNKFGIFAIKDPENHETLPMNEKHFIDELKAFLEG